MLTCVQTELESRFKVIQDWLKAKSVQYPQLLYSSVDIRESLFKCASIDTNLFPAGFNNLSLNDRPLLGSQFNAYIQSNFATAKSILLFCEDHTRNTYYLENIYQLQSVLSKNGYKVTLATYFKDQPSTCSSQGYLNIDTAEKNSLTVYCLDYILRHSTIFNFDLCVLNNDLTEGNLHALESLDVPIVPSVKFGWYQRKKSHHIKTLNQLTRDCFSDCGVSLDPWLFSTIVSDSMAVDINNETDRKRLAEEANLLLQRVQSKYNEHQISDAPYLVLKSDNGTYGMGVIKVSNAEEILLLNRKKRNKLAKGKASRPISHLILQEGVPSVHTTNQMVSEEVVYLCNGITVGGFYRMHPKKSETDILNATGMVFKPFSGAPAANDIKADPTYVGNNGVSKSTYLLSQLANLAAQMECAQ